MALQHNTWRDEFIQNGTDGFKRKPEDSKLSRAERKIGQLELELELVKKKERIGRKTKKEIVGMLLREVSELTGRPYPISLILKAVFRVYQMDYPDYEFYCTLLKSRQVWPEGRHNLDIIAGRCGYDLQQHHHALADAEACAIIAKEIL